MDYAVRVSVFASRWAWVGGTVNDEPTSMENAKTAIERIAAAQSALALVDSGLNCEHGDLAMCPRFQSVLAERVDSRSAAGDVAGD